MDLSIIIVSYNVREKLQKNLESIFNSQGDFSFEVLVVDNNSIDGSAEMVTELFPQVHLIKNERNMGFAVANNMAIKKANGNFILLLNPDMRLFPDTLYSSLAFAQQNPQAIVSSCLLVDSNNKTIKHIRRFPKLFDQLAIILKIPHVFPKILRSYLYLNFDYNLTQKVDSVRGSFFMINTESFKKISEDERPLLDERYFVWFEEVDFCRQVYKLGGEVWYNPNTFCLDYVGQSFSLLKRGRAQKYFCDSMLKYFEKWHPYWQYRVLKLAWPLGKLITFVFSVFGKNVKNI
ncbi:MAG: glycosyltransferase family 2 protein [Patescibacteria group bacterium]|nr:glycosyltransferase family 2 protein [Patescibacteria group bacterium]